MGMDSVKQNLLLMKILGNANRLKILQIVYSAKKDICVYQIAELADTSQSLTSHQLAYLSARDVIKGYRMGQTMCYIPTKNELSKKLVKLLKILSK